MKKIIFAVSLITMFGCHEKGDIKYHPHDFININGKTYKLMSVYPCDDCNAIWILYPSDSSSIPQTLNYNIKSGKSTINQTVIKVD